MTGSPLPHCAAGPASWACAPCARTAFARSSPARCATARTSFRYCSITESTPTKTSSGATWLKNLVPNTSTSPGFRASAICRQRSSLAGMARLYGAFPITLDGQGLHVAFTDPLNPQLAEDLRFGLGKTIVPVVARRSQVQSLDRKTLRQRRSQHRGNFRSTRSRRRQGRRSPLRQEANSAPNRQVCRSGDAAGHQRTCDQTFISNLSSVNSRFATAWTARFYEMAPPPVHLATSIISRVKVMANMNIAERRIPQDGRIMTTVGEASRSICASTRSPLNTVNPSCFVFSTALQSISTSKCSACSPFLLRLHRRNDPQTQWHLHRHRPHRSRAKQRRFTPACAASIRSTAKLHHGRRPSRIRTRRRDAGPDQRSRVGLTFAKALRAFLRQDPDRIMVGEMRDLETAQIAIQASLTGHLGAQHASHERLRRGRHATSWTWESSLSSFPPRSKVCSPSDSCERSANPAVRPLRPELAHPQPAQHLSQGRHRRTSIPHRFGLLHLQRQRLQRPQRHLRTPRHVTDPHT
jgi:hypothetical protein